MVKDWDKNIQTLFEDFSDESFQRRSWFGIGPEKSSPEEMGNWLEDFNLVGWLDSRSSKLPRFLVCFITDFIDEVDKLPESMDPWVSFCSPEWNRIRLKASVIRDLIRIINEDGKGYRWADRWTLEPTSKDASDL